MGRVCRGRKRNETKRKTQGEVEKQMESEKEERISAMGSL